MAKSCGATQPGADRFSYPFEYLAASGTKEEAVRSLLLRTRFAWVAVLVDARTAQPVKLVLGERIN